MPSYREQWFFKSFDEVTFWGPLLCEMPLLFSSSWPLFSSCFSFPLSSPFLSPLSPNSEYSCIKFPSRRS